MGDGDTPNDIVIVDNDTLKLRASVPVRAQGERTITYQADETCGNTPSRPQPR